VGDLKAGLTHWPKTFVAALAFLATVVGLFVVVFAPEYGRWLWALVPAAIVFASALDLAPPLQ